LNQEQDGKGTQRDVIDLDDHDDVRQWTETFDVAADELTAAVHAVGPRHVDVMRYVAARKR
jgi:NADH-quinone oxidoreductase subunit B